MKAYYNIHNIISISIEANESVISYFNKHFHFFVSSTPLKSTINVKVGSFSPKAAVVLGTDTKIDGDFIIEKKYNAFIKTNLKDTIVCQPKFPLGWLLTSVYELIRIQLTKRGYSLVHASAAEVQGKVFCFCSWQDCGKTDLLLHLLSMGAKYIADEYLIIDKKGKCYPYFTHIKTSYYNFSSLKGLSQLSISDRIKGFVFNSIRSVSKGKSQFHEAIRIGNHATFLPTKQVPLSDVKKTSQFEITPDYFFVLTKTDGKFERHALSKKRATEQISAISYVEWNADLVKKAKSFAMAKSYTLIDELLLEEKKIIEQFVGKNKIYALRMPAMVKRKDVQALVI